MKIIFKKSNQAFTLVELVTVLLITGILGIIALPKFFNTSIYQSQYFYNDILYSLRYAQKLAMSSGCHIQANFTSNSLTLNRRSACTSGTFTIAIRNPSFGSGSFVKTAPSGVSISSSINPFYYDGLGRTLSSATNTISNVTLTVGGKTISVVGQTGFTYDPST